MGAGVGSVGGGVGGPNVGGGSVGGAADGAGVMLSGATTHAEYELPSKQPQQSRKTQSASVVQLSTMKNGAHPPTHAFDVRLHVELRVSHVAEGAHGEGIDNCPHSVTFGSIRGGNVGANVNTAGKGCGVGCGVGLGVTFRKTYDPCRHSVKYSTLSVPVLVHAHLHEHAVFGMCGPPGKSGWHSPNCA